MLDLSKFIKKYIKNVTRVDFLPYHKLGSEKYDVLGIEYPYKNVNEMDKGCCDELYQVFIEDFSK